MRFHLRCNKFVIGAGVTILLFLGIVFVSMRTWEDFQEFKQSLRRQSARKFSIPELMGSSNVFEVVQPNVSTIVSQPSIPFLKGQLENRRPFAVILVTSMAKSFKQRHSIRLTWYKWAEELNIRVFFMIGFHDPSKQELFKILQDEQRIYSDLIIDNYEEGYYRLSGKVLRMLKWYNATYSEENSPRFFIKTDQDVFINLPNLVSALRNTSYYKNLASLANASENLTTVIPDQLNLSFDPSDPETYYVGGKRFVNPQVDSNPDSKWYMDSSERERLSWSANLYPTYVNGPLYVFSANLVPSIYETSFSVPLYPFEDVYVVGMIVYDRLNLYISDMNGMLLEKQSFYRIKSKTTLHKLIAIHPVEYPAIMMKFCRKISICKRKLKSSMSASKQLNVPSSTLLFFIANLGMVSSQLLMQIH